MNTLNIARSNMTREEAIKEAYGIPVNKKQHEALQILIPELAKTENEDEKIRKELIYWINTEIQQCSIKEHADKLKSFVDWLEKQKGLFEYYNWNDYKDKPELWNAYIHGKAVGLELGKAIVKNNPNDYGLEKQKEQDKCPEYCVKSHCMDCPIYEKQKEQRPVVMVPKYRVGDIVLSTKNPRLTYKILEIGRINELNYPQYKVEIFTDGNSADPANIKYIEIRHMDEWGELVEQKPANIDYISGIREELLSIENNAKDVNGLTESQWVAIRAAHRLLGEYIEKEQKPISKFKVGDRIYNKRDGYIRTTIRGVGKDYYINDFARKMDMAYTDANFELLGHLDNDTSAIIKPTEWSENNTK